jgi:hypothetical protein
LRREEKEEEEGKTEKGEEKGIGKCDLGRVGVGAGAI